MVQGNLFEGIHEFTYDYNFLVDTEERFWAFNAFRSQFGSFFEVTFKTNSQLVNQSTFLADGKIKSYQSVNIHIYNYREFIQAFLSKYPQRSETTLRFYFILKDSTWVHNNVGRDLLNLLTITRDWALQDVENKLVVPISDIVRSLSEQGINKLNPGFPEYLQAHPRVEDIDTVFEDVDALIKCFADDLREAKRTKRAGGCIIS